MQVVVNLAVSADDLITDFGSGAKVYLYRAESEGGSYSLATSTALVSGTSRYELYDDGGTPGTSWYKFRAGNSAGDTFGAYSAEWQSTSRDAYATVDEFKRQAKTVSDATDGMIEDHLRDVSADFDVLCGRRFYRDPQVSGTSTWTLDVVRGGMRSLTLATMGRGFTDGGALDIVSITTLEVRDSETGSYVTIAAGDTGYYLQPGDGQEGEGEWPYEDVVLSPACTVRTTWPTGYRAVRITGVRGFAAIPRSIAAGTIAEARERIRQGPGGGPSQQGVNQFGVPVFLTGDSPQMRRITRIGSPFLKRSWASL